MLTERFAASLPDWLLAHDAWRPYPTVEDRDAWNSLPAAVRTGHIKRGDARLGYAWPTLPATLYLEFPRIGNRINFETSYFARRYALTDLVLAECMTADGRYLDEIVNGLWLICEESTWCLPAHIRHQQAGNTLSDTAEPIVDLFAAETGSLLAWVLYLLGERLDGVSPVVRPRLKREITQRILTPCLARDDFWWMGFVDMGRRVNNWNPWICSNWLASILLVEGDPALRLAGVEKAVRALDNFIDPYPQDGGCDEGPNYWGRAGASLFDCLELLHSATAGRLDVYDDPLIGEIGRFVYRAHIDDDFYLNFADASAIIFPEASLIYRYGRRIDDDAMAQFGAWLAAKQHLLSGREVTGPARVPSSLGRALPEFFVLDELANEAQTPPLVRDVWLPEIQVMVARDQAGTAAGFYVAAKGGHNDESHNHNDIGNFVIYRDGKPVLVDAGVETYTAKTFSERRYEIWTMQSAYHSLLPTVDGVQQAPGEKFAATAVDYAADEAQATFHVNIAAAYPAAANMATWQRTITLQRGKSIDVTDTFRLTAPADLIEATLLTPCAVDLSQPGRIVLSTAPFGQGRQAGEAVIEYDARTFQVRNQRVPITDERMGPVWGEALNRLVFQTTQPELTGQWAFRIL